MNWKELIVRSTLALLLTAAVLLLVLAAGSEEAGAEDDVRPVARIGSISPNPAATTDSVRFDASSSTDDGTIIRYIWNSSIDGSFYNDDQPVFSHTGLTQAEHTITLVVLDDQNSWSEEVTYGESLVITQRPVATIFSISPAVVLVGDDVTFKGNYEDDGNVTRFVWHSSIDGEFHNGTGSHIIYTALSAEEHNISFKVLDEHGLWSEEITSISALLVLNATGDEDDDDFTNDDEIRRYQSDPCVSNLLYISQPGAHIIKDYYVTPENPISIDEITIILFVVDHAPEGTYYLHYKTMIDDWKTVGMDIGSVGPHRNVNSLITVFQQSSPELTSGRCFNITYTFQANTFTTGEKIEFYITNANGYNYNDEGHKSSSNPSNVENIKSFSIESKVEIITSLSQETYIGMFLSLFLAFVLLRYRFFKRFEKVKYSSERELENENFRVFEVHDLFTRDAVDKLLLQNPRGSFVGIIYFVGICGLLLLSLELLIVPEEMSVFSQLLLIIFLGISILVPFLYAFFINWKKRLPAVGRLAIIIGFIAVMIIVIFFLIPNFYPEGNFAQQNEDMRYTYLAFFFLLFGVPMVLYGNIMGTNWNYLTFSLSKEVRKGFSCLSWERVGYGERFVAFFQLFAIGLMPLLSVNTLIGLAAGNYADGGYIGVATSEAIAELGYEEFARIASRLIAIFIVLNVVIVGAAMIFRVVQLQFLNTSRFSGKYGLKFQRHGNIKDSEDNQLTLLLMVFGIFFGYTILLLLLSVYSNFGYLMPQLPYLSVSVMELLMIGLSAATNVFFLFFWLVSAPKARKTFKTRLFRDETGRGYIVPRTSEAIRELKTTTRGGGIFDFLDGTGAAIYKKFEEAKSEIASIFRPHSETPPVFKEDATGPEKASSTPADPADGTTAVHIPSTEQISRKPVSPDASVPLFDEEQDVSELESPPFFQVEDERKPRASLTGRETGHKPEGPDDQVPLFDEEQEETETDSFISLSPGEGAMGSQLQTPPSDKQTTVPTVEEPETTLQSSPLKDLFHRHPQKRQAPPSLSEDQDE